MAVPMQVLMVDDSSADLLIASKVIERSKPADAPVTIQSVASMAAAETRLRESRFDCVLLDLHLPDGRGAQNVRTLRALAPHTPVVVLSGSESPAVKEEVMGSGASAYVGKKPLRHADDLYAVMANAIRSQLQQADHPQ